MLVDKVFGELQATEGGYSLEDLAKYLMSLGSKQVMTNLGIMQAKDVAKLVLSGAVKEIVVFGGPTIRVAGTRVFSTVPLPLPGTAEAELTYSHRELKLVKMADLLLSMGVESAEDYHKLFRDPVNALVKAVDTYDREKKRNSPMLRELKSALLNILDLVADVIYVKEGERADAFTVKLRSYSRSGEFDELTEHVKHRLHTVRTLQRLVTGNGRAIYKTYIESGRHYIVVFDRSGSMAEIYRGVTKKAMAALIVLLIAKADPEAKYSLVVFDSSAKVLAVKRDVEEIVDNVVELEPAGGTSYVSGLTAADKIMEEGDILIVVGDFLDGSPIPSTLSEGIRMKAGKVLLIPVGDADISYAKSIARQLNGEIYIYRNGILVQLQ